MSASGPKVLWFLICCKFLWHFKANLKNVFVSPYPTLFYWYRLVGRKYILLTKNLKLDTGLPLGGRTPYITSKNRLRTPKLHIKDVPRTSENSLVRPKMDIETSCLQKKPRPHLPDYAIYVPPSYWKLIYFVY